MWCQIVVFWGDTSLGCFAMPCQLLFIVIVNALFRVWKVFVEVLAWYKVEGFVVPALAKLRSLEHANLKQSWKAISGADFRPIPSQHSCRLWTDIVSVIEDILKYSLSGDEEHWWHVQCLSKIDLKLNQTLKYPGGHLVAFVEADLGAVLKTFSRHCWRNLSSLVEEDFGRLESTLKLSWRIKRVGAERIGVLTQGWSLMEN